MNLAVVVWDLEAWTMEVLILSVLRVHPLRAPISSAGSDHHVPSFVVVYFFSTCLKLVRFSTEKYIKYEIII